jgi:hypothetical protein
LIALKRDPQGEAQGCAKSNGMITSAFAQMFNDELHRPQATDAYALDNGKTVIIDYDNGTEEVRTGGSISWRDNNPGNMSAGEFANDNGAIGINGNFAIFPDTATGHQAAIALLETAKYQNSSLQTAIGFWAPPKENNTLAYVTFVSNSTGISSNVLLSSLSSEQTENVFSAMQRYEGWQTGKVDY